jgi:hypothetical protein
MNDEYQIQVGTYVSVHFHASQFTLCEKAEVMHVPIATGDSWIFKDLHTNDIHYVSEGCTITKWVADPF